MSTKPAVSLSQILEEELQCLHGLLHSLHEERAALIDADVVRIDSIAQRKARELTQVADLAERRAAWRSTTAADAHTRSLWQRVRDMWRKAQRANEINGAITRLHVARAARAMNVVHQLRGEGQAYRADGRLSGQFS